MSPSQQSSRENSPVRGRSRSRSRSKSQADDFEDELDKFIRVNELDRSAEDRLRSSSRRVQERVIDMGFDMSAVRNPSAIVMSRITQSQRGEQRGGGGRGGGGGGRDRDSYRDNYSRKDDYYNDRDYRRRSRSRSHDRYKSDRGGGRSDRYDSYYNSRSNRY